MAYAAYDDLSIYAVHDTADGALARAKADAGDPEAVFRVAPISDGLAYQIVLNGWDGAIRSFEIGRNGWIVDTTSSR